MYNRKAKLGMVLFKGERREEGEREKREEKVDGEAEEGNVNSRYFQAKIIIIF